VRREIVQNRWGKLHGQVVRLHLDRSETVAADCRTVRAQGAPVNAVFVEDKLEFSGKLEGEGVEAPETDAISRLTDVDQPRAYRETRQLVAIGQ
jgi:hypothetical protein